MKINAYHGTPFTFAKFDTDYQGYFVGAGTESGFFFAEERNHAEYWCERNSLELKGQGVKVTPRIMSVTITTTNIFEADMMDYRNIRDIITEGEKANADCIQINNAIDDESGEPRTMYFISDPANVRILKKERYSLPKEA